MTGWIILGIIAVLLVLLCLLRVGVYVKYEEQLLLRLRIGPVSLTLFPREKKEKDPPVKVPETKEGKEKKDSVFQKPNLAQIRYTLETLPGVLVKALRRAGKGILVKPLHLRVVFAGDDPADTAQTYGKAQALVSAFYPELKKLIKIRDTKIALSTDYEKEELVLAAEAGITLRIGTILRIALGAGFGLVRWLMGYRKRAKTKQPETDHDNTEHDQAAAA